MDYIFNETFINHSRHIIFLCGVSFNFRSVSDKRKVLKKFLEAQDIQNKVVILEENFIFGKPLKRLLSYDDIFVKDLNDIESLMALFANYIFIVHESISTAAELGMLASNKELKNKICLLIPDEFAVEENKISNFIDLGYFRKSNNITSITYYPVRKAKKLSDNKIDWLTYFNNDTIGQNLGENIISFLSKNAPPPIHVQFKKEKYGKYDHNCKYSVYGTLNDSNLKATLSADVLFYHVISFFNIPEFNTEIRKEKQIKDHVSYLEAFYLNILTNTFIELFGTKIAVDNVKVYISGTTQSFRDVLAFSLYVLQAIDYINMIESHSDPKKRKIVIRTDLAEYCKECTGLYQEKKQSLFGRTMQ